MTEQAIDFEATLSQLKAAIDDLENGNLPLDKAIARFEAAMTLSKQCQSALSSAELKISQLTQDGTLSIDTADRDKDPSSANK